MTYEKLLKAGREMGEAEIARSLKDLMADPRFAALAAVIERVKEQTADASCEDKYAGDHGLLAHASGVRFGLRVLEGKLRHYGNPPRKTAAQRPPEAE